MLTASWFSGIGGQTGSPAISNNKPRGSHSVNSTDARWLAARFQGARHIVGLRSRGRLVRMEEGMFVGGWGRVKVAPTLAVNKSRTQRAGQTAQRAQSAQTAHAVADVGQQQSQG